MKKITFLLLLLAQTLHAHDTLEESILSSNIHETKKALTQKENLTELRATQYLDLAQHMIVNRYEKLHYPFVRKKYSGKVIAGAVCALTSLFIFNLGAIVPSLSQEERVSIILLSISSFAASFWLIHKGTKETEEENKQLYENALHIKQLIYKAAYSSP